MLIKFDNLRQSAPFWSEDFQSGIPTTWTNSTAPWVYRGPGTPPGSGVGSQGAYASNSTPIASPTANNGFIIFDSDYYDNNGVARRIWNWYVPLSSYRRSKN